MKIGTFYLSCSSRHYAWVGEIENLSNTELAYNTPLTIHAAGVSFALLVDDSSGDEHFGFRRSGIKVIGQSAIHSSPRANKLTASYNAEANASALASTLIGGFLWSDFVDWLVPAGRLDYTDKTPFEAVNALVTAAGGIISIAPNGALSARRLFKQPIPVLRQLAITPDTVDVVLNEWEVLSLTELGLTGDGHNSVNIIESTAKYALSLEVDARPNGHNNGVTDIKAGGSVVVLVFSNATTPAYLSVDITAGTIAPLYSNGGFVSGLYEITEQLTFVRSKSESLSRPANNVRFKFIGKQPAGLSPAVDNTAQSVLFSEPVTCLLEVKYDVPYLAYQAVLPNKLDGSVTFQAMIAASYAGGNLVLAHAQRGDGSKKLADYADPLITGAVANDKAQSLLDAEEKLTRLRVVASHYQPVMKVGAIIGFFRHDGTRSLWVIDSIEIRGEQGGKLTVTLEVISIT